MKKIKKKGFTLIELIAVLVIMAILVLIVTPLVMNIIRKARISADKRSIDAYGRSIELAIAGYLMDTGSFPTSIDQLTIEYSGDEVVCSTTQINTDSSVYLAGCKVAGRSTGDYVYGKEELKTYETYSVGDEVTYNGVDYYVLKDSGERNNVVTLIKVEPLTVDEVTRYGIGHINNYAQYTSNRVVNSNGYGGIAYYTSETCGIVNNSTITTGCTTDYTQSEVKYVVDAWAEEKISSNLREARLITIDEYLDSCSEKIQYDTSGNSYTIITSDYEWLYNNKYWYWTLSEYGDSNQVVWYIDGYGVARNYYNIYNSGYNGGDDGGVIRPVVELYKNDGITRKNSSNN